MKASVEDLKPTEESKGTIGALYPKDMGEHIFGERREFYTLIEVNQSDEILIKEFSYK